MQCQILSQKQNGRSHSSQLYFNNFNFNVYAVNEVLKINHPLTEEGRGMPSNMLAGQRVQTFHPVCFCFGLSTLLLYPVLQHYIGLRVSRAAVFPSTLSCTAASTRSWLRALNSDVYAKQELAVSLATDLDYDAYRRPPSILLSPNSVQPCLRPWADAVADQSAKKNESLWWQDRPLVKATARGHLQVQYTRDNGGAKTARDAALDGGVLGDVSVAPLCTLVHDVNPVIKGKEDNDQNGAIAGWSPALYAACANGDDVCFFESILSLSIPILWSSHVDALSELVGYDVQSVFDMIIADRDGQRHLGLDIGSPRRNKLSQRTASIQCAPPTMSSASLPAFDAAAALQNLDRLLDRHVPLTRHPHEDKLIEATYSTPLSDASAKKNHSLAVWFWGGEDFRLHDTSFKDNFGDMSAVHAVSHALAVRTGAAQKSRHGGLWGQDIQGVALSSSGRATQTPYLMAVGSIMAVGTARPGVKLVWGSGFISADPKQDVHVDRGPIVWRGVRGPLSRALLLARHGVHTPVIRDPALLVPSLLPCCSGDAGGLYPRGVTHQPAPSSFNVVFVLHAVDVDAFKASPMYRKLVATHPGRVACVSNVNSFQAAIADLWSGKRVVASSLHAVILAHAYGIPVLPVRVSDKVLGGDWKFQDHYFSVGHYDFSGRVPLEDLDGLTLDGLQARIDEYWQPDADALDTGRMLATFPFPHALGHL